MLFGKQCPISFASPSPCFPHPFISLSRSALALPLYPCPISVGPCHHYNIYWYSRPTWPEQKSSQSGPLKRFLFPPINAGAWPSTFREKDKYFLVSLAVRVCLLTFCGIVNSLPRVGIGNFIVWCFHKKRTSWLGPFFSRALIQKFGSPFSDIFGLKRENPHICSKLARPRQTYRNLYSFCKDSISWIEKGICEGRDKWNLG